MRPVEFPGHNTIIAKDQPEYLPLPAFVAADGQVTSCWAMTWRERARALFTGRIYVTNLTFWKPLQPQIVSVDPPAATD